jgi:hypothetical protein
VKVSSPDGTVWRVTRRWVPWRRRVKGALDWMPDLGFVSLGDDPISAILGIILLVLLIPFVVLALISGVELLLVLVILPFAILGRVLFGRHWTVEVRRGWRPYAEEQAGDWQASGLRIHALADALRRGDPPLQTLNVPKEPGAGGS